MSLSESPTPNAFAGAPTRPDGRTSEVANTLALKGKRAVLYLRVSSKGQVNTDYDPEGLSIPAQRGSCIRKAEQLGLTIIEEYVEPGRSATEMTKRIAFQQMLDRIRRVRDIDYVIVYELSRLTRNRTDDAIVMADLKKRGVTLISATESIDESPVGQLMQGLLAAFNEYRSAKDGADIAYKMHQKVKTGGTIGRAPIGYLNTIDRFDGRDIRSVSIDEERAPFVKLAFDMYATGEFTMDDIVDELTDRGLSTRSTGRHPSGPLSISKLSRLLRDRYYLGLVVYKGEVYEGRHTAIIDQELFSRVQHLLESRGQARERYIAYPHYLKGSIWCGHCRTHRGINNARMIVQKTGEYWYFFCKAKQDGLCESRYIAQHLVEDAVLDHYKTAVRFRSDFIAAMRALTADTVDDAANAKKLLQMQLRKNLKNLDLKTTNLIDLAADGAMATAEVRTKLREIEHQRTRIREQLDVVSDSVAAGAQYLNDWLDLLEDPYTLYKSSGDETRRRLNQAIFKRLWVTDEDSAVTVESELNEPIAELVTAQAMHQALALGESNDVATNSARDRFAATAGASIGNQRRQTIDDWLATMDQAQSSSKPSMVRVQGL
ncbi:MAG TPA: recombinase family protein [Candidatus Microsaccharimonas sp.]